MMARYGGVVQNDLIVERAPDPRRRADRDREARAVGTHQFRRTRYGRGRRGGRSRDRWCCGRSYRTFAARLGARVKPQFVAADTNRVAVTQRDGLDAIAVDE